MNMSVTDIVAAHSSTRLGDWYAVEFTVSRQQLILCVSQNGRLPLVVKAAPYKSFPERLVEMLDQVLRQIGISENQISREIALMSEQKLAKTTDRSIVGTLTQFRKDLECSVQYGSKPPSTLLEASMFLADGICMPLEEKVPAEAVKKIFTESHLHLVH